MWCGLEPAYQTESMCVTIGYVVKADSSLTGEQCLPMCSFCVALLLAGDQCKPSTLYRPQIILTLYIKMEEQREVRLVCSIMEEHCIEGALYTAAVAKTASVYYILPSLRAC